jgi:hypothetical protein
MLMNYLQLQLIVRIGIAVAIALWSLPVEAVSKSFDSVPVTGMVTMIDLGAKKCIPWRSDSVSDQFQPKSSLMKTATKFTAMSVSWENRILSSK